MRVERQSVGSIVLSFFGSTREVMVFFMKLGEVFDSDVIVDEIYCGKKENKRYVFIVKIFADSDPQPCHMVFCFSWKIFVHFQVVEGFL